MRNAHLLAALVLNLGVLTVGTAPAVADTADIATRQVRTRDLDLASNAGQATLRYRIGRAIEGVCGSYATTAEPTGQDATTACRARAKDSIDRQIAARAQGKALASAR